MSDWPNPQCVPMTVTTYGRFGMGGGLYRTLGAAGGQAASFVIGQNVATYCPIWLPFRYPVQNFFFANGSTVNGNIDIGIYTDDGSRLWSAGPTLQAGTSALQFFAKDIVLDPGQYYLACASSSATGTGFGNVFATATRMRYMGFLQQGSLTSGTLPSPATFATYAVTVHAIPMIGFTWQSGTPNF